jgi:hypothetical protein
MSLSLASRSIDNKAWILNSFLTTLDLRMVVWCELEKNLVAIEVHARNILTGFLDRVFLL